MTGELCCDLLFVGSCIICIDQQGWDSFDKVMNGFRLSLYRTELSQRVKNETTDSNRKDQSDRSGRWKRERLTCVELKNIASSEPAAKVGIRLNE